MSVFKIGFVIFPDLTQLDFTGPQQVLARLPDSAMHIVAKTLEPVPSDSGLSLLPTHTFSDRAPLDLICIPGGYRGVIQAMADRDLIAFVQRQAQTAKYVSTSVCTGAFILGAARLLKGRRVTTHRAFTELLTSRRRDTREAPRCARWESDHSRRSHYSGIDFGLQVMADMAGEEVAKSIQLGPEYDPSPPFASGHPDHAATSTLTAVMPRYEKARADFRDGIEHLSAV